MATATATAAPSIPIYLKNRLTYDRIEKLKLMVTRKSPSPLICWPLDLVKNADQIIVGYIMPMANGKPFNTTIFKPPLLQECFPACRREHLVQLAITTLSIIKKLHDINVLIGDVNPNNFMVLNEKEIYLVDTDSFQIEGFPCPVGMTPFIPPELFGKSFGKVLRTKENEVFAVATLIFMILFIGKSPYSGQKGGDVEESIKNHKFPWVTEEGEQSARPFGPYKFIWSHLHHLLRRDFREIFYDGLRTPTAESHNKESSRPVKNYIDRFLVDLKIYLANIRNGKLSNDLFPKDGFIREGQDIAEIPCGEPGCSEIFSMSNELYLKLYNENPARTFRCPKHAEINRLRHETMIFNKKIDAFRQCPTSLSAQPQNAVQSHVNNIHTNRSILPTNHVTPVVTVQSQVNNSQISYTPQVTIPERQDDEVFMTKTLDLQFVVVYIALLPFILRYGLPFIWSIQDQQSFLLLILVYLFINVWCIFCVYVIINGYASIFKKIVVCLVILTWFYIMFRVF